MRNFRRVICAFVVVTISGCTSVKTVPLFDLGDEKPLKGTFIITTRDERTLKTDRVAAEDSALVVSAVIIDGERQNVEPINIPYGDIVEVSQERTNWVVLGGVVAGLTALVIAIGWFLSELGPIGQ